jgi:predicted HicB family RNase H-like nuclease
VTYEAKDLAQLKKECQISVEDYLAFCDERSKEPNKPFKVFLMCLVALNYKEPQ